MLQYGNVLQYGTDTSISGTALNSLLVFLMTLLFYTPPVLAILVVGPQTIEAHAMVSYISRHPSDDASAQVTEYHESRRGTSSTSLPSSSHVPLLSAGQRPPRVRPSCRTCMICSDNRIVVATM